MEFVIPRRWRGYPEWGHGGYGAGLFCKEAGTTCEVRLQAPLPLGKAIKVCAGEKRDAAGNRGWDAICDGVVLMTARPGSCIDLDVAPPPPLEVARAAGSEGWSAGGRGVGTGCAVCDIDRSPDDGIRLLAGPIDDGRCAAVWTPGFFEDDGAGLVPGEVVSAVLDCPAAAAVWASECRPDRGETLLTVIYTCEQLLPVNVDEPYIVTSWVRDSRLTLRMAASALHDVEGNLVASSKSTWMVVDRERVNKDAGG